MFDIDEFLKANGIEVDQALVSKKPPCELADANGFEAGIESWKCDKIYFNRTAKGFTEGARGWCVMICQKCNKKFAGNRMRQACTLCNHLLENPHMTTGTMASLMDDLRTGNLSISQ